MTIPKRRTHHSCDSNGDEVGDLPGITSKLDYIARLGAVVIWICTLQDTETLIHDTHVWGMKIMLDLDSRASSPPSFLPQESVFLPDNWHCKFGGGSVWEWDEQSGEYYLHLFAKEQPDLNWENPITRKAVYASAMEFWLERGRKPPGLPDAPEMDPRAPYQAADMLYCNGPRMQEFLSEMNRILAKYGAISVGELPLTPDMARVLQYVSAEAKQLDMVFQFDVVNVEFNKPLRYDAKAKDWQLPDFKEAVARTQTLIKGTDAWTTCRVASGKMLAILQACLSGTQFIYQGQELGAINVPKDGYPLENYVDVSSRLYLDFVREHPNGEGMDKALTSLAHLARGHPRVPKVWNGKAKYGGFSEEAKKSGKEAALFRKQYADLLVYGDYRTLRKEDKETYTFVKEPPSGGSAKAVVALNFTGEDKNFVPIMSSYEGIVEEGALKPYEGRVCLVSC
ncbi:putative maltase MLT3 [Trichoderma gracile]